MKKLFLGLILLVIVVLVATNAIADNAATALQAQAAIEAGKAAKAASVGSTIGIILLGMVLMLSWGVIGVLVLLRVRDQRNSEGKWVSGPNARWGKVVDVPRAERLGGQEPSRLGTDPVETLLKIETLRMLKGMHQEEKTVSPAHYESDEREIRW